MNHGNCRESEEKLQLESEGFQALLKTTHDGYWLVDTQGVILDVNDAYCKMSGYAKEEIVGQSFAYFEAMEDERTVRSKIEEMIEVGHGLLEAKHRCKSGETLDVEISVSYSDVGGGRFFALLRDITERKKREEQLQDERILLQTIINSIPVRVFWKDLDGVYQGANQLFLSDAQLESESQIIGKNDFEMVWADRAGQYRADDKEVADSLQAKLHIIEEQPQGRGKSILLDTSKVPLTDRDGSVFGILGIYHDITKEHETTFKLKQSKEELDAMFQVARDGIVIMDLQTNFLRVNEAFVAMTGFERDELLQTSCRAMTLPDEIERTKEALAIVMEKGHYNNLEKSCRRKDGSLIDLTLSLALMPDRQRILVNVKDITQQKAYEKQLLQHKNMLEGEVEESETFIRNIMEATVDGIVTINEQGVIQVVNKAVESLFGYDREELIGQNVNIIIPEPHRSQHNSYIANYLQSGIAKVIGKATVEVSALHKDGTEFPVSLRIGEINMHGRTIFTALIRDITEQKKSEEAIMEAKDAAEQAARVKSDFLANMSHEIRTPMNAIIGMSHLALETDLDKTQRNYVEKIYRSSELLLSILNDILDMSKIESGKLHIERISFSFDDVLEDLSDALSVLLKDKSTHLTYWVEPDVPLHLIGDPLRLRQIFLNLVSNAIKFTENEEGDVILHVEVQEKEGDEVLLHFAVQDNGIGMSEAQQEQLFQAFVQADTSTTRTYGGTGLGLVITKRLLELMGGRIWVESQEGEGSTFHFTIPYRLAEESGKRRKDKTILGDINILFVDDHETIRDMLEKTLKKLGYQITTACCTEEALKRIAQTQKPFDLIITDWRMAGQDGVALIRQVREQKGLVKQPKVIVLTAHDMGEVHDAFEGLDVDGFLGKPICLSGLTDIIVGAFVDRGKKMEKSVIHAARNGDAAAQLRGAKVLLVEDNDVNQELAIDLLQSAGINVVVASNGKEALERLETEETVDGILMDCQMPVMDGYEATRRIRAQERYKNIPILALTANVMAGDHDRAMAAGMNDQINKPIRPSEMYGTMAKWIVPSGTFNPDTPLPQPEETAETIPPIEGIDIEQGMATIENNTALYLKLLRKFRESRGNDFEQVFKDALASGDAETAERAVHTLKGIAGSIGAMELYARAFKLNESCKNHAEASVIATQFAEVVEELVPLLKALEGIGDAPSRADKGKHLDKTEALRLLEEIIALVSDYDAKALSVMEDIQALPGIDSYHDLIQELGYHIEEFDNDGAVEIANRLVEQLKASE